MKNIGKWVMAIFCISFSIGMLTKNEVGAFLCLILAGCFISPPFISYSEKSREKREGDKYKPAKDSLYWSLSAVIGIIGLIIGLQKPAETQTSNKNENPPEMKVKKEEKKWYEDGTLHNASVGEWRKADDANKLATCADFMVAVMQKEGLKRSDIADEQLMVLAKNLKDCVEETIKAPNLNETRKDEIRGFAAICYILMKEQAKQQQGN